MCEASFLDDVGHAQINEFSPFGEQGGHTRQKSEACPFDLANVRGVCRAKQCLREMKLLALFGGAPGWIFQNDHLRILTHFTVTCK